MMTLHNQIMGIQGPRRGVIKSLQYEKIIGKLQETIKLMQKQILYLRLYANYAGGDCSLDKENEIKEISSKETIDEPNSTEGKMNKKITGLKGLMNQIMKMVNAKNPEEILFKLRIMEEKANRKTQPVFLQRVKTKEVPVIIEKVKEVEKIVNVEKIVEVEKKVEVPVFREKIVEKFIGQSSETSQNTNNEYQLVQEKPRKKIPPNPYRNSPSNSTMSSNHHYQENQSTNQNAEQHKYYQTNPNRGGHGKSHNYQNKTHKYREKTAY